MLKSPPSCSHQLGYTRDSFFLINGEARCHVAVWDDIAPVAKVRTAFLSYTSFHIKKTLINHSAHEIVNVRNTTQIHKLVFALKYSDKWLQDKRGACLSPLSNVKRLERTCVRDGQINSWWQKVGDGLFCELVAYSQGLEFALLKITWIIQSLTSNLQTSIYLSVYAHILC